MDLPTIWFTIIGVLWFGYLLLECFDMGVGMHLFLIARTPIQRRVLINTIGPVWDGNEVWLITATAAIFAAFPTWYASLLSGLYLPIVVVLLALIARAVGIEYRSKHHTQAWTRTWDAAIAAGSLVASFGVGAMLAITTTGLPIDAHGDRVGGPFAWLSVPAVVGGLAVVGFSLIHGATFLALRADGPVRGRARAFALRWTPIAVVPFLVWALWVHVATGTWGTWLLTVAAVVSLAVSRWLQTRGAEGWAFGCMAAFLALGVGGIFGAVYPVVLPSTLDRASDLTVWSAASGDYSLGVMSVVALFGIPAVVATQAWSYWVFRARLAERHIPPLHETIPAVGS